MNLTDLTITQALEKLRAREITATELTRAYLNRIEKFGAELNCYITVTPERALADAAESDKRYANGTARACEGIPIAMKDLFATRGIRTTAGSHILENFIPQYESTVSQKLRDAGTVLLGKTNMSEFGMASTPKTSYFGPTVNPYNRGQRLSPGGSSSGSASSVAAGLALAATGTDTGNSVKFPASLTGLVGMKPSYGVCSRFGCFPFASSLDHPGAFGRTVDDAALMMAVMAGHDENESTSAPNADEIAASIAAALGIGSVASHPSWGGAARDVAGRGGGYGSSDNDSPPSAATRPLPPKRGAARPHSLQPLSLQNIKLGVIREFEALEILPDIKRIFNENLAALKSAGAEIIEVSVPRIMDLVILYNIIARNEVSSNLARYDGMRYGLRVDGENLDDTYKKTRAAGFGSYVKYRLVTGSIMLTREFYNDCFLAAAKIRRMLDNELRAAFEKCDFILNPASPCVSQPLGDESLRIGDDFSAEQFDAADTLNIGSNMSGLPAVSVPMGMVKLPPLLGGAVAQRATGGGSGSDSGQASPRPALPAPPLQGRGELPVGMHIMGRRFDDLRTLQMAKHIESFANLDNRPTTVMGE
ncbi:MAG: aspartyl/glutamyl-tRNA amidotransferase subunit A [Proteobacteria bacterium]|nr:aspartyl/glutamyl-tRNA amidotransferase subunit A [Pseudomonadota bacterium]